MTTRIVLSLHITMLWKGQYITLQLTHRYYQICFSNLTRLVLKNPKMIAIDVDFVEKLGRWCSPNLKNLSITLYYRDLFSKVHKFKNPVIVNSNGVKSTSIGFLSKLESLTIDGDVSLCLIESLLTSVAQSLKSLTIYIHRQVYI